MLTPCRPCPIVMAAPNCSTIKVLQLAPDDGRPERPVSNNFFPWQIRERVTSDSGFVVVICYSNKLL